jgi:hypothetical protein
MNLDIFLRGRTYEPSHINTMWSISLKIKNVSDFIYTINEQYTHLHNEVKFYQMSLFLSFTYNVSKKINTMLLILI